MQNIGAYGVEVKDVVEFVEYVDLSDGYKHILDTDSCQFGYRDSIFKRDLKDKVFISYVVFKLYKIKSSELRDQSLDDMNWIAASLPDGSGQVAPRNDISYTLKLDYKDIQVEMEQR